jgi:hypothetical protein
VRPRRPRGRSAAPSSSRSIAATDDGLRIAVHRSKADQQGEGDAGGLPYGSNPATCPVRAWRGWLEVSGITEGTAFRAIDRHGWVLARHTPRQGAWSRSLSRTRG